MFKKVVRKIKANPFERFCRSLDFFAYPFKPLANPLKALEKPLTSRSLAVSFYLLNGKPLVYVFLEKVTNEKYKKLSRGLNPSWRHRQFNNKMEPTDNAVWSQTFCSGPGFNSISPDIKSFIFDTQDLLVQLHDFTVLCLTKQCILACLLFCNNLFAAHLLRFAKSVKKQSHLCTYVTYHNL